MQHPSVFVSGHKGNSIHVCIYMYCIIFRVNLFLYGTTACTTVCVVYAKIITYFYISVCSQSISCMFDVCDCGYKYVSSLATAEWKLLVRPDTEIPG